MKNSKIVAIAALGLVGAVALVGCSSSSNSNSSSSATPTKSAASESPIGGNVLPPVMVEPGTTTVSAKVGDTIVFKVADPENTKIATDNEAVLQLTQGGKDGSAMMNPGAKALTAGTAKVTITGPSGEETVTVTVA